MKKLILKIRSEEGTSSIMEAIIVYPIVMIVVIFLLVLGLTYAQKGYLTYKSQELADYIAKNVIYPGYAHIEKPFYDTGGDVISVGDINAAMKENAPYRYMFGIFGSDVGIKDNYGELLVDECAAHYAAWYLRKHGILKAYSGDINFDEVFGEEKNGGTGLSSPLLDGKTVNLVLAEYDEGYLCAVSATTSGVKVYMAQNYIFARFFNMIGIGGRNLTITAKSMSAVSDSVEIVKTTDMAVDVATFLGNKLGFDMSQIDTLKDIIQGND